MACEMTDTSFDKIRKDYETSLVLLQKHRYEAEKQEKVRLDKIKEYRIQQMIIMEQQKDADPGNELPTTSKLKESSTETEESDVPSSEEDEPMSITPITRMVKKTVLSSSARATGENNKTEKKDAGKQKKRKMNQNMPLTPKVANPVSKVAHGDIISVILKRLDSIEKRLNDPVIIDEQAEANNATSSSVNTVPSTPSQRTTFAALKLSWIPQLFTKLNAIHADIVSSHTNE